MSKKKMQEINASSMADIAFLLLIFFLVTTTMNVDTGLPRMLPPMPQDTKQEKTEDVNERNVLLVRINQSDKLLVAGKPLDITQLREKAKEFIANPNDDPNLPEKSVKEIAGIGAYPVSEGIISLQNSRQTTYKSYIAVQNELIAAYNELRDELAMQKFGKRMDRLSDGEQKAIQKAIPQRISEAEPVGVKGAQAED